MKSSDSNSVQSELYWNRTSSTTTEESTVYLTKNNKPQKKLTIHDQNKYKQVYIKICM